jgi:hypothetical protein
MTHSDPPVNSVPDPASPPKESPWVMTRIGDNPPTVRRKRESGLSNIRH